MSCIDFESQIALYVGGDLTEKEFIKVEKHLAVCSGCAQFMVELQESQLSLVKFGQTDVSEDLFTNLRASVLEKIVVKEEKLTWWKQIFNPRFVFWRYAFVPTLLLALTVVSYFGWLHIGYSSKETYLNSENIASTKIHPVAKNIDEKLEEKSEMIVKEENLVEQREMKKFSKVTRKTYKAGKSTKPKLNNLNLINVVKNNEVSVPTSIVESQVKMEIQTSNPNIRIIWFVNKGEKPLEKRTLG